MMYDKLIKNLRHDSVSALQNCEFDFVHDWMLKAADAIEDLDNKLNLYRQGKIRNWIPVNERTPDKRGEYFVWGIDFCTQFDDDREYAFVAMWDGEDFRFRAQRFTTITHWMPIPEPTKEE